MLHATLSGLALGLALIVAIGAQNLHVLRQGLRREHIATVVAICAASDIVLIVVGSAGLGRVIASSPALLTTATLGGVAVVGWYALAAARRAWRPQAMTAPDQGQTTPWARVATTTLALTWLNPHVYLDTVVLVGSVSATFGADAGWFTLGAGVASVVWFTVLGFGAALVAGAFARPTTWRVFDAVVAAVMASVAVRLALTWA